MSSNSLQCCPAAGAGINPPAPVVVESTTSQAKLYPIFSCTMTVPPTLSVANPPLQLMKLQNTGNGNAGYRPIPLSPDTDCCPKNQVNYYPPYLPSYFMTHARPNPPQSYGLQRSHMAKEYGHNPVVAGDRGGDARTESFGGAWAGWEVYGCGAWRDNKAAWPQYFPLPTSPLYNHTATNPLPPPSFFTTIPCWLKISVITVTRPIGMLNGAYCFVQVIHPSDPIKKKEPRMSSRHTQDFWRMFNKPNSLV